MLAFLNKLGFISQFLFVFHISVFEPDHLLVCFTFIYLFSVVLGLHHSSFSSCGEHGLLFVAVCGFPIRLASPVVELRH